ncbi:MAG TPA: DUF3710 domain-containing protein [Mycobacterium sp.]|nr:DUF3710 domain-containing protein [Mycolicibacterium sp.]HPX35322.1 DUF3710 domain-containing protein [Mycobacterium sp.]HQC75261.1 DUF3710 domain-containing protein [Mycobacterium sp.]
MMAFGRRKRDKDTGGASDSVAESQEAVEETVTEVVEEIETVSVVQFDDDDDRGPFDLEDFDNPDDAALARLDLGSVLIPMPPGGQVQVEMQPTGLPNAIWVVTPNGRFTIAAYAAPKSPGLWREIAGELAEALRNDNAAVSIQDGPWGREVIGTGAGVVRFIGVDGYRWMIRCVANGTAESIDAVAAEAREALADTVVRRGETPLPVRTPLPVQLPEEMAAQLRAAAAQQAQQAMFAAQQAMLQQQQIAAEQEVQRQQQEAQRQQELEAARLESERQEAARRAAEGAALPQSSEG